MRPNRLNAALLALLAIAPLIGCAATHEAPTASSAWRRAAQIAATPTTAWVMHTIRDWPKVSRVAAINTMEAYGVPHEATPTRLVWFDNGPWKRTVVTREGTQHAFPMPHEDVLEQTITYDVPPDKLGELAHFDGSVSFDRARGELSARCDMEAANFIALNLAHDVITGRRAVDEARAEYARLVVAKMSGSEPVPYAEKLQFEPARHAGFPDDTTMDPRTVQRLGEKKRAMMREVLGRVESAATETKPRR